MAVTNITVTGAYGATAQGIVDFVLSTEMEDVAAKRSYPAVPVSASLTAGAFSIVLPANNDPTTTPLGVTYQVTERIVGALIRTFQVVVPYNAAAGTIDISALTPVVNSLVYYPGTPGATGPAGAPGAISLVDDEGTPLPVRSTINFIGAGVTAVDNAGASRTDVTIPGGGGGSAIALSTIAFAATITPAVSASINVFEIGALTANITVANPTGAATDGMTMVLRFVQNATGGWTTTFGAAYVFGTDVAANLIPLAASSQYELTFRYHALTSVWRCVGIVRGFTS